MADEKPIKGPEPPPSEAPGESPEKEAPLWDRKDYIEKEVGEGEKPTTPKPDG